MSKYKSFAVTETGISHIKQGKNCQDSFFCIEIGDTSIAIAADGHGDDNCFRSEKGAKLAVNCAVKGIAEFVKIHESRFTKGFKKKDIPTHDEFNKAIRDLVKHIIAMWQVKVEEDYKANPITSDELAITDEKYRKKYEAGNNLNKAYGTTLIAAAITSNYWLGIHIGDGRLTALYPDGSFDQPIPWDEKCYLNVTTSICDDDALEQARLYFSFNKEKTPPAAVIICTDGIDDNYPVEGNEKHLFKLYRTIALTFAKEGFDSTCEQLKELANAFATKGKGDDTSIAGFIDLETLKKTEQIWQKQIDEEEKIIVKKNEKEEKKLAADIESEKESSKEQITLKALQTIIGKEGIAKYGEFTTGKINGSRIDKKI